MTRLCFDYDSIKYAIGFACEERHIVCTHKNNGGQLRFANRTEFYGGNKKGGWLAEFNAERDSPHSIEEYIIEDVQTLKQFTSVKAILDAKVNGIVKHLQGKEYYGYIGRGRVFRHDIATIMEYKGNRNNDINENMGKLYMPKITYNQFNDFIINFTSESNRYCVDKEIEIKYQTILSCFVSAVYNFKNDLDQIFNSECFYDKLLHEHNVYVPFKTLEKCNDFYDFNLWSLEYGKFLPSLRVKSKDDILKKSSLEGFFN